VLALSSPSETVTVRVAWPTPTGLIVSVRVLPVPVAPPVATALLLLVTVTVRPLAGVSASPTVTVRTSGGLSGSPRVRARSGTGFGEIVGGVFVEGVDVGVGNGVGVGVAVGVGVGVGVTVGVGVAVGAVGANATPRNAVLAPAVVSWVAVALMGALNAAESSTLTSALVLLVVANSVTPEPFTVPVSPRTPSPGRKELRAVHVVPSKENFRIPPFGLAESSAM